MKVQKPQDAAWTRAEDWFSRQGWRPFPFQTEVWQAYLQGKSGLLNAPTGSGKTYALWFPILIDWMRSHPDDWKRKQKNGLQLLWITPLRALANDIRQALQQVCDELEIPWTVALRTGDTKSSIRQQQMRAMPECLITTPESLHLLISQKDHGRLFKNLQAVVVDEWHELLGTKRGVQTELALAHLRRLRPESLRVWGVSATIGNLPQALDVLFGQEPPKNPVLIRSDIEKEIRIESILPDTLERFPWAGHLGTHLLDKILPILESSPSTLLFTNTRSQTEIWYRKLMDLAPELAGLVAMHHGSLDQEVRRWVEDSLHQGKLKLVICTSSLDLGVDFKPVETVIQVGSPKGIARFLQRAGRSGHQPGALSRIYFLPTHALELIEGAALKKALETQSCESRPPLELCYDVLVQYLVTRAIGDGFQEQDLFEEVRSTYCFRKLSPEAWQWALGFVSGGGSSLSEYEEYQKLIETNGFYSAESRKVAMRHRLSMGTIVSDPALRIKYVGGSFIGTIEESFISRLKPGDAFWFAGHSLQLERIKDLTVLVRKSKSKQGIVPRWSGGRLPLSGPLSHLLRRVLSEAAQGKNTTPEIEALAPILALQARWSVIPDEESLLIEYFRSKEGFHLLVYPFEGRAVHELLAALTAYRICQLQPISFSIAMNDYGFELLSDQPIPIEEALSLDLFRTEGLEAELRESINSTEMARRRFREIATIAGLIFTGYPNKGITHKHLQASAGIIFDVYRQYEPDSYLLRQAEEEVFQLQLEAGRLQQVLDRINKQRITLQFPPRPTPFAFPILVDRLREHLSSEKLEDRIRKMQVQLEDFADRQGFLK